ncbi:MAG TPA: general secretion pathway protein GspB [Steroidobacteraceae bacterium]|nr:general secretion pathway protein GspB [Steroidobacteraceae bacterium]
MSFILDALKKSETDRQRQTSPALFEVKVAAPRRRFPLWAVGLAVLLGVNFVVLAWVLLRSPTSATASGAAPVSGNAPVATPAPAIVTEQKGMVTLTMPADATSTVTVSPNRPPDAGIVAPSNAPPLAEEPLLSGGEPTVPPNYNANDYAPAVTPAEANAATAGRDSGIPSRDEVLAQGTQLPELRLDLHVYAAKPQDRFVFINMRKLREGESLPEGVRVEAITLHGAELSYRGKRFTLEGN